MENYFEHFLISEAWNFNSFSHLIPGHLFGSSIWAPTLEISILVRAGFQITFVYQLLSPNVDAWGSRFEVVTWKVLQTPFGHRNSFLWFSGSIFDAFLEALGRVFLVFCALETGRALKV